MGRGRLAAVREGAADKAKLWVTKDLRSQYQNYVGATLLFFLTQVLMFVLMYFTVKRMNDFSAAILGMLLVSALTKLLDFLAGYCGGGRRRHTVAEAVDRFYRRFLKGPTDLLNKHMSIGFTVPFVTILKESGKSPKDVGLIAAAYIITGILSIGFVFTITFVSYSLWLKMPASKRRCRLPDFFCPGRTPSAGAIIAPPPQSPRQQQQQFGHVVAAASGSNLLRAPSPQQYQGPRRLSDNSMLTDQTAATSGGGEAVEADGDARPSTQHCPEKLERSSSPRPDKDSLTTKVVRVVLRHAAGTIVCPIIITVGIILVARTDNVVVLDVGVLFSCWLLALGAQAFVKHTTWSWLDKRPKVRITVAALVNPVLVTSCALMIYVRGKQGAQGRAVDKVVDEFSSNKTLARVWHIHAVGFDQSHCNTTDGASNHRRHSPIKLDYSLPHQPLQARSDCTDKEPHLWMGAGDVANSILESGLVSWAFKLFECRQQIFSPAGGLTIVVSAASALFNVVCFPLIARRLGLDPPTSMAFAARGITLALGQPALDNLHGDKGINAIMVVMNGVIYQVSMGIGVVGLSKEGWGWLAKRTRNVWRAVSKKQDDGNPDEEKGLPSVQNTNPTTPQVGPVEGESSHTTWAPLPPPVLVTTPDGGSWDSSSAQTQQADESRGPSDTSGGPREADDDAQPGGEKVDDAWTVATGVTVGNTAAAMGTAFLNEHDEVAAPYSALAMTTQGVMTVLFSSIVPLSTWLKFAVGITTN